MGTCEVLAWRFSQVPYMVKKKIPLTILDILTKVLSLDIVEMVPHRGIDGRCAFLHKMMQFML